MRKQDPNERAEAETILETYMQALGMLYRRGVDGFRHLQGEMATASYHLVRLLVQQNEEALRGLRARPPSDLHGPAGQRYRMTLDELSEQTRLLRERLEYLASEPVEPRQRRTYRDIQPGTGVIR